MSTGLANEAANRGPRSLDERIAEQVDIIRAHQERIAHLDSRMQAARTRLYELLSERGESWSDDEGYARLVEEGERTSYDVHALDELIINDPLRYGWLKDYRKTTTTRGGVRVK